MRAPDVAYVGLANRSIIAFIEPNRDAAEAAFVRPSVARRAKSVAGKKPRPMLFNDI
jgi:hypothetical protein